MQTMPLTWHMLRGVRFHSFPVWWMTAWNEANPFRKAELFITLQVLRDLVLQTWQILCMRSASLFMKIRKFPWRLIKKHSHGTTTKALMKNLLPICQKWFSRECRMQEWLSTKIQQKQFFRQLWDWNLPMSRFRNLQNCMIWSMKFRNSEMPSMMWIILREMLPIHTPARYRNTIIHEADSSMQDFIRYLRMFRWADRQALLRMAVMRILR